MAKSNIYTKTGDKGTTSLVGGQRVQKNDARLNAYGTIDELNSFVGAVISQMNADADMPASDKSMAFVTNAKVEYATLGNVLNEDHDLLYFIQNQLFIVGSYLATDPSYTEFREASLLQPSAVEKLESRIDLLDSALPKLDNFILPGGCQCAAVANLARAVCRRAEREIIGLTQSGDIDELIIRFINRLSDYLFILSRAFNIKIGRAHV